MSTREKIQEIKKEYQEIVNKISKPGITKNISKLQNLSRQKAQLERIILDYEKLQKVLDEIKKQTASFKEENPNE